MPLPSGTRLGAYEIVAPLGAGGMGEVYRARDTRLDRTVAIKVLPAALAADVELRQRFEREARAVSSLQHPHICALFDVGEAAAPESGEAGAQPAESLRFLVLEYLDGETVAQRITRAGAMPPAASLKIGIEICDALDRAHRSGIVHRDLKPANVMLTKSGAKLLDFGLARPTAPVVAASGPSMLPTTPPSMTARGAILGTFQYMAPEQIEGQDADARTDIFAFGALLFEMLTGRAAFEGRTRASLLGAILKDEPPRVSDLQPLAPAALDRVVATCLAKDPDDRYQSARDLLRDLKWATAGDAAAGSPVGAAPRRRSVARLASAALVLALLGMLAGALVVQRLRPLTGTEPIQFTVPAPAKQVFGGPAGGGTGQATQLALSPDGRLLAFVAAENDVFRLWIRSAGSVVPRLVSGSEGAAFPFWSPDGRYVAFFANDSLKKVGVAGGSPIVLCPAPNGRGGTWNRDNIIVFGATTRPLQRVSASGGIPIDASKFDAAYGETSHRWPHFLPDGHHFLYTATIGVCCPASKPAAIRIGSLDSTADSATVFQVESSVAYAMGHLLYSRDGTLMAQPFDAASRRVTGEPFPVADTINSEGTRYASFSASPNGVLAYARGAGEVGTRLTWRDRAGNMAGTIGDPALNLMIALSRDDAKVAVVLRSGSVEERDIWIVDAARGTRSRLTFEPGADIYPVWSPDGARVAFQGVRSGDVGLRQKLVTGNVADELLTRERVGTPTDWSADGRFIALNRPAGNGRGMDIWILPTFGNRKPFPFVETQFDELSATFSPDGHWIAYVSTETGVSQIYVQPFPATGGRYQVSRNGGSTPTWRADGKELFYLAPPDARLTAVSIDTTRGFDMGDPLPLFATDAAPLQGRQFAVSNDGKRFLINTQVQHASTEPITVVVNWLSAVQR